MLNTHLAKLNSTQYAFTDLTVHLFIYFLISVTAYLILFKTTRWAKSRIDPKPIRKQQLQSEIKHSLLTIFVFAVNGGIVVELNRRFGWFRFYEDVNLHGLPYLLLSPFLFILLHDTYFYWTHRLMHRPSVFKRIHAVHHQSYSPTPFTVYSFHWGEAFVESCFVPTAAFFLPMHPLAMFALIIASQAMNLIGHAGHEFLPRWFYRSFLAEFFTTTTHHHFHHSGGARSNYGFYFRIWDRLCGTEDPRYAAALDRLRGRPEVSRDHASQLAS
jgi:lathosterol oxidase